MNDLIPVRSDISPVSKPEVSKLTRQRRKSENVVPVGRSHFVQPRSTEFFTEDGLRTQMGIADRNAWIPAIVKELIDNALDACEEKGVPPQIEIECTSEYVSVADNGPGLPQARVPDIANFEVTMSSRAAYVTTERGAQGNALKTAIALSFLLGGHIELSSQGQTTIITLTKDPLQLVPEIDVQVQHQGRVVGTKVKLAVPNPTIRGLSHIAAVNPHAHFLLPDNHEIPPTDRDWKKSTVTSAIWYTEERFNQLFASFLARDPKMPISRFVGVFDGFSRKIGPVIDEAGVRGTTVGDLSADQVRRLRAVLQNRSDPVKPSRLGVLGKQVVRDRLDAMIGLDGDTYQYKRAEGEFEGRPYIIEVAFALRDRDGLILLNGANFSATPRDMFRLGYMVFPGQRIEVDDPVVVFVHVAMPRPPFDGKGKNVVELPPAVGEKLWEAVAHVTRKWKKEKERSIRHQRRVERDKIAKHKKDKLTQKDAFELVIESAYLKASNDGKLPATIRQVYYAARPQLMELTKADKIDYNYFSQTLWAEYQAEHPEKTERWRIIKDARGRFVEPHGQYPVDLGTLEVEGYIDESRRDPGPDPILEIVDRRANRGPKNRFQAVVFIEKEGFGHILEAAQFADRFDVAIMACKGQSVIAARRLADEICGRHGLPLFVIHDFDIAGIDIENAIKKDGIKYQFTHAVQFIDLGLSLEDVEELGLESEPVTLQDRDRTRLDNMREDGIIDDETHAYLAEEQRVELNMLTAQGFVDWLEGKMEGHGVEKVIGDDAAIVAEWRSLEYRSRVRKEAERIYDELFGEGAKPPTPPTDASELIEVALREEPAWSWRDALRAVHAEGDPEEPAMV